MVLDDASTPDSSFSSPTAPSNDLDRYSGDQNPTELPTRTATSWPIKRPNGLPSLNIDFSGLAMPWMPFGQASSDAAARETMGKTTQRTSDEYYKVTGRPLEQSEADAVVFHLSKALRLASFGPPMGITAAVFAGSRQKAWQTFRFPGWTPGEKFNPEKFLFMQGRPARIAWHMLRFNCYFVLGLFAGQVLMGSYAMTVANVGRLQDPRLKELNETLRKKATERAKEKGVPIDDRTEGRRGPESFEMARQRTRAQNSGTRAVADDMSPTGGSFSQDYGEGSNGGGDMGMLSDSQIQQLQQQEQRTQDRADEASTSPVESPQRSDPRTSRSSQSTQQTSKPTGSAWERLRQQAGQQPSQQQQQSSQARQSSISDDDDAFGFSNSSSDIDSRQSLNYGNDQRRRQDQAGQQVKSDAQRQFDAQLDREREGKSFEEKGGNGRW